MHYTSAGVPDAADKLIMALGLGSSGQDYSPVNPAPVSLIISRPIVKTVAPRRNVTMQGNPETQNDIHSRTRRQASAYGPGRRCPRYGGTGQICRHIVGECICSRW